MPPVCESAVCWLYKPLPPKYILKNDSESLDTPESLCYKQIMKGKNYEKYYFRMRDWSSPVTHS